DSDHYYTKIPHAYSPQKVSSAMCTLCVFPQVLFTFIRRYLTAGISAGKSNSSPLKSTSISSSVCSPIAKPEGLTDSTSICLDRPSQLPSEPGVPAIPHISK